MIIRFSRTYDINEELLKEYNINEPNSQLNEVEQAEEVAMNFFASDLKTIRNNDFDFEIYSQNLTT